MIIENAEKKEYSRRQNKETGKMNVKQQEDFWLKEFREGTPVLNLPLDYPRPAVQSSAGNTIYFELGKKETTALKKLAKEQNVTLLMMLSAIFNILLAKLSGQEDIIVGTPAAARKHPGLENITAVFVNTLLLRNYPAGEKSFKAFLEEVSKKTADAFENREYQFEKLVEQLAVDRDPSRNPLFDAMFVMQDIEAREVENNISKPDMTLTAGEAEKTLAFELEYRTKLFKEETIKRFIKYFRKIVLAVITGPGKKISEIEILSQQEKKTILVDFNNTGVPYPGDKTIYQLFEEQVEKNPDNIAIIGPGPGPGTQLIASEPGNQNVHLTYNQLNKASNQLAHHLQSKGVGSAAVIGIMTERSLEMVKGIWAILKSGATYLPIDPSYPKNRILDMLEEAHAGFLLTTSQFIVTGPQEKLGAIPQQIIIIDESAELQGLSTQPEECLHRENQPEDLIYIIFTSGSTGKPKGAGIYHRSFYHLVYWFVTEFRLTAGDSDLLITSLSFDLTQKNIYAPLLVGGTLGIPSLNYFDPGVILREVSELQVTWLNCTPSMMYRLIEWEAGSHLDKLACLRYVFLGGEPISISMMIHWIQSDFFNAEIVNTYGPTECTDICSSYRLTEPLRFLTGIVPTGGPIYNVQLYVLDSYLQLVATGVPGELFIGGEGVGIGYVNDKKLTSEKFLTLSPDPGNLPPKRIYHTGDLARWLPDGNIEFLGRIDQQVKIRGRRVELGEIESQLLNHEKIKDAIVIEKEVGGRDDKYLCAYVVGLGAGAAGGELREYLSYTLPDYMIPTFFVAMEKIPLTPNGKVNRKALPEPEPATGVQYVAPGDELEQRLVKIWSTVLGIDKNKISMDDNFFELGGHSLKAITLISGIHKVFNVRVSLEIIFKTPTIKELAGYIKESAKDRYRLIEKAEQKEYYVLSSPQKRLYILHQMEFAGTGYNLPAIYELEEEPDHLRLEDTFKRLIRRHESFRTCFDVVEEEPVQRIRNQVEFEIEYYLVEHLSSVFRHLSSEFIRPFDLSEAPLLRVGLIKFPHTPAAYTLMVDMHHIISDGISMGIFQKELIELYDLKELPPLKIQYKEYSQWQSKEKKKETIKEQEEYWLKVFAGELPVLNLPLDYTRPAVQSFAGRTIPYQLSKEETGALKALAKEENATLFMVLAAIFNVLLAKLSGQEDIVIGTPAAGRQHPDLENIIGMFVNTLALRSFPDGEKTFIEFLKEIRKSTLDAFDNQEYQFEELVDLLMVNRDPSRNPLFDAVFALQNMEKKEVDNPGLKITPCRYESNISKFDLAVVAQEAEEGLSFDLEYCTKLFKEGTIKRFSGYFRKIISSVCERPQEKLMEIEIISEEERNSILNLFNDTTVDYPSNKTIHRLFKEQVEKTPDYTALHGVMKEWMHGGSQITYGELNDKSNQLTIRLQERGVVPDSIVAIMLDRSLEMIIGILGILKAGGAYMPIDPDYPGERITYMLKDSGVKILVTSPVLSEKFEKLSIVNCQLSIINCQREIACSAQGNSPLERGASSTSFKKFEGGGVCLNLQPEANPSNLAYIIYTSGSTGKPKGVMVEHQNVVRLVKNSNFIDFTTGDRLLLTGAIVFDITTFETWGPLLSGITLFLAPQAAILDGEKLGEILYENEISILHLIPQLFNQLADRHPEIFAGLKYLLVGGDIVQPHYINKIRNRCKNLKILHMYGPTENTTFSTFFPVDKDYKTAIPIGKPISNSNVYIIDKYKKLKALGAVGELSVGGAGVSRGYLNNPELTFERFDHDLWDYQDDRDGYHRSYRSYKSYILYKTGDLARWLPDGNLEFLGRQDHQVKVRGFRIELGEIENQLLDHPGIKETAVISTADALGDKHLCAYIVTNRPDVTVTGLREYLAKRLPGYMIPSYFVTLDKIPLMSNGKVDRKSLPEPEVGTETEYTAPRDEIEKKLVKIWAAVLGTSASIGIDNNFFELGGHSLKGTVVIYKIHKEFSVRLSLAEIFKTPTIRGLTGYIKTASPDKYISIEKTEKKDYYVLSSAQKRLYILDQIEFESTGYNIPAVYQLEEEPDRKRLEAAFRKLIHRHESFRTAFEMVEEEPVQRIHHEVEFEIEYYYAERKAQSAEHSAQNEKRNEELHAPCAVRCASTIKDFIRPFNLSEAPLLRAGLITGKAQKHILMVDMHHIISDGISFEIFQQELVEYYGLKELPPLDITYKDYSEWQRQNKKSRKEKIKKQEDYWLKEFTGEIPVLNLPVDFVRPAIQNFEGKTIAFELGKKETGALKALAKKQDVTLFMTLAAIFNILLGKLSGQEDIVMGTPAAGRSHPDLENIIGMFVNTLALRNYPYGEKTFSEFLKELGKTTLDAFENQEYQFEELVGLLIVNRDPGRNPLFDVVFALQNLEAKKVKNQDLNLTPWRYDSKISKFDLALIAKEVEEGLSFEMEYCTKLFKEGTIKRFIDYYRKIISFVIQRPHEKLMGIEIIPDQERKQILYNFNRTKTGHPRDKTIHALFNEQVEKTPDYTALHGCMDTWTHGGSQITYRELNDKSNQLACRLQERGVVIDSIAAIMMNRSLEMVIGILGILKAGGAYMPIDPDYPGERITYMLKDSGVKILVTSPVLSEKSEKLSIFNFQFSIINCQREIACSAHSNSPLERGASSMSFKKFGGSGVCLNLQPEANPSNLAYIIYTSGSTGKPKGVMVEHRNVVRLVKNSNFMDYTTGDRLLLTGAIVFDITTFETWGPLLNGLTLFLVDQAFILDSEKLGEILYENKISILHLIPQLFNQLADRNPEIFAGLKYLLVGGDIVQPHFINKLRNRCKNIKILHMYGPTENTTFSTFFLVDKDYKTAIPIGKPISNSKVYIIDKYKKLKALGAVGELIVGGAGVSRGYLNNPELTTEKFDHDLWDYQDDRDKRKKVPGKEIHMSYMSNMSYIYRTGDLARWLPDGNIEFLGRQDQQVKIRGFRIELGEIENQLLNHAGIKEAVVISTADVAGDQHLCAYIVPNPVDVTVTELRDYLSKKLPDYMIPSYFKTLDKIPLTANGKVDRKSLPGPGVGAETQYAAPGDEIEEKLVKIWAEVLGASAAVGIDDNFFELGGHSLKGTVVIYKIHKEFSVKISLAEIFKVPTVRGLAKYIKTASQDKYMSIEKAEEKEYFALSSAQTRLYILNRMEPESVNYNIPILVEFEENPDRKRLEDAFMKLINRHESFRTSFGMMMEEEDPVQRIHDKVDFEIEYFDAKRKAQSAERKEERHAPYAMRYASTIKDFIRPFDLSQVPLLRAGLVHVDSNDTRDILIVDMHHIISDGTSMEVFQKELIMLYELKELPVLKIQYKDYCQWRRQGKEKRKEKIKKQENYWLKKFAGEIPVLNLPLDYERPVVQSFEGNTINFELGGQETAALKKLASEERVTLFMILAVIFNILLAKLSGQEDIIIGIPTAGRSHPDLENIIAMFVNTLALRNYPAGEKSVKEFLEEVKKSTLEAFENQEYQFEELVEQLAVNRDASRNPLFDAMFVMQDIEVEQAEKSGLKIKPYKYDTNISKFDMTLTVNETEKRLAFELEYCTKLFEEKTIKRFTGYFKKLVSVVIKNPAKKILEIEIISKEEKKKILYDFNNTETEYPKNKTIRHLFEKQVERTPDRVALIGPKLQTNYKQNYNISVTYRELNEKADGLAYTIIEKGVKPDIIVGIMMERSIEMIIGILGILKAGGAYMPIDPDYPEERITYMLKDSSAKILVTSPVLSEKFKKLSIVNCQLLIVNEMPPKSRRLNNPPKEANSINNYQLTIDNLQLERSNLAYIIYTSGTTGRPKGVLIEHKNLVRLLFNHRFQFDFNETDVWTLFHSFSFDFSVWEMYGALLYGGQLVVVPRMVARDPQQFLEQLKEHHVTILNQTPSAFYNLIREELKHNSKDLSLRCVIFGGEALKAGKLKDWKKKYPKIKLVNMFGITETCVHVTYKEFRQQEIEADINSIGNPIPTLSTYIMDRYQQLLSLGTPGELYVGGAGVARGYLNRPGLTAEKFVENSYKPGERLYKSGDRVRWSSNDEMHYLGRIDNQVQIRGFRIELGEIENRLLKHEQIKEAVVIHNTTPDDNSYLCAYFVPDSPGIPSSPSSKVPGLRDYLSMQLPDYMIPSFFVPVEKIPLTPNGKLDRKALPEPGTIGLRAGIEYVPPRTEMEKLIAGIWQEVLRVEKVGIHDKFFNIGGNSLNIMQMNARLNRELGTDKPIPVVTMFRFTTISALASCLSRGKKTEGVVEKPIDRAAKVTKSRDKRLEKIKKRRSSRK